MTDPLDLIEQGCYLCHRFTLRPSAALAGCLEVEDGVYVLKEKAQAYHPLEAVLLGEAAVSDDVKAEAALRLGVSSVWIEGFFDGFAQAGEASSRQDYIQGYLTAEELRQRRPGLIPANLAGRPG